MSYIPVEPNPAGQAFEGAFRQWMANRNEMLRLKMQEDAAMARQRQGQGFQQQQEEEAGRVVAPSLGAMMHDRGATPSWYQPATPGEAGPKGDETVTWPAAAAPGLPGGPAAAAPTPAQARGLGSTAGREMYQQEATGVRQKENITATKAARIEEQAAAEQLAVKKRLELGAIAAKALRSAAAGMTDPEQRARFEGLAGLAESGHDEVIKAVVPWMMMPKNGENGELEMSGTDYGPNGPTVRFARPQPSQEIDIRRTAHKEFVEREHREPTRDELSAESVSVRTREEGKRQGIKTTAALEAQAKGPVGAKGAEQWYNIETGQSAAAEPNGPSQTHEFYAGQPDKYVHLGQYGGLVKMGENMRSTAGGLQHVEALREAWRNLIAKHPELIPKSGSSVLQARAMAAWRNLDSSTQDEIAALQALSLSSLQIMKAVAPTGTRFGYAMMRFGSGRLADPNEPLTQSSVFAQLDGMETAIKQTAKGNLPLKGVPAPSTQVQGHIAPPTAAPVVPGPAAPSTLSPRAQQLYNETLGAPPAPAAPVPPKPGLVPSSGTVTPMSAPVAVGAPSQAPPKPTAGPPDTPPVSDTDRRFRNDDTGEEFVSDGKKWVPAPAEAAPALRGVLRGRQPSFIPPGFRLPTEEEATRLKAWNREQKGNQPPPAGAVAGPNGWIIPKGAK